MTGSKSSEDAACPEDKRTIPMNQTSFFTQAASVATVSETEYDNVDYSQEWRLNGVCDDAETVANCSVYFDVYGKDVQDSNDSGNVAFVITTDGKVNVEGWELNYETTALHNAEAATIAKATGDAAVNHDLHRETSEEINHVQVDNIMRMAKANTLGAHPSTIT